MSVRFQLYTLEYAVFDGSATDQQEVTIAVTSGTVEVPVFRSDFYTVNPTSNPPSPVEDGSPDSQPYPYLLTTVSNTYCKAYFHPCEASVKPSSSRVYWVGLLASQGWFYAVHDACPLARLCLIRWILWTSKVWTTSSIHWLETSFKLMAHLRSQSTITVKSLSWSNSIETILLASRIGRCVKSSSSLYWRLRPLRNHRKQTVSNYLCSTNWNCFWNVNN